ncbi:hypothetical protein EsH8_VIII_001090 [Colletotrichum jinshuiense]
MTNDKVRYTVDSAASSTIAGTANILQIGISEKLGIFMEFNGMIFSAIIVAFIWSWKLTLVTGSIILLLMLVLAFLLPFITKSHAQMANIELKATSVASESFSGIRMLTACGAEDRFSARYSHWVNEARGYDTQVGDSGAKLSDGQRQRIAIASSIIKKPKIVILDEATSANDVSGEQIVQAALNRVAKNRTTITVAHRLSTIMKADRIVVLKKGCVMESGTHESLLQNEAGLYYGLVLAQKLSLGDASDTKFAKKTPKVASRNFGRLLHEQRNRWPFYISIIFFACVAAGTPLKAWLFAKVLRGFTLNDPQQMRHEASFGATMWVVLAICVGLSYAFECYIATYLQHHMSAIYQQQYFTACLYQKTSFYDNEENSQGTLTFRVLGDPKQLE